MANNIASERARIGMTQQSLAEKLMVSEPTVRRWEKNEGVIPTAKLLEMAALFGCTIEYLLAQTEERTGYAASTASA